MQRARWLLSSLSIFACAGDSPEPAFSPIERTLAELRAQIDDGTSCRAIVRAYAQLHAERDPELRAFVTWNEAAAADAERLDAVPAGERGPLHCAPIVVKDNIDVAGLPTTGGVRALARSVPGEHAVIVARLVEAGAVVLGKTNMPDFALDGVNTLSSARGQTDNPYAAGVTVYGSSGGTARRSPPASGSSASGPTPSARWSSRPARPAWWRSARPRASSPAPACCR